LSEGRDFLILATSDVHSPVYLKVWSRALEEACSKSSRILLFIAGDLVNRGKAHAASLVEDCIRRCKAEIKVVGVFGNDDFEEVRDEIAANTPSIEWLDDEIKMLEWNGALVRVYGTTGVLDELTSWQSKNMPWLKKKFEARLKALEEFSRIEKEPGECRVLLSHYPPTYKTLVGEPRFAWPQMGSQRAEMIIERSRTIDLVIHGHAHKSKVLETQVGGARVLNVAFPAVNGLVEVSLKARRRLLEYM